jgi:hypothetical protein
MHVLMHSATENENHLSIRHIIVKAELPTVALRSILHTYPSLSQISTRSIQIIT